MFTNSYQSGYHCVYCGRFVLYGATVHQCVNNVFPQTTTFNVPIMDWRVVPLLEEIRDLLKQLISASEKKL